MKRLKQLRNIGIIAHVDAGKTTVAEQMLWRAGAVRTAGRIDDGNTTLDFSPEEIDRGITIESAATRFDWRVTGVDFHINFIDTPGHVDFTVEVERALRVLDGAIAVVSGVSGVEPQTETVWRQADRHDVPRIVFVNKLDLAGASFEGAIESIEEKLGVRCLAIQAIDTSNQELTIEDVVTSKNVALIEALAEVDDLLMARFVDGDVIDETEIWSALARATRDRKLVPVLGGAALKGRGVDELLDAAIRLLPAPCVETFDVGDDSDAVALVFKRTRDPFAGRLTWVRIYRGELRRGDVLLDPSNDQKQKIGRLVRILADRKEEVDVLAAGDVGAVVGLDNVRSGATLCAVNSVVMLSDFVVSPPVVWMSVEASRTADTTRLATALNELTSDDPSVRVVVDRETGETLVGGQGELQLEIVASKLAREFEVEANFGRPVVAYRETIATATRTRHRLKKQTGGPGMFAEVDLEIEPGPRGSGISFEDRTTGGAIPAEYVTAVEAGVRGSAEAGRLEHGFPIVNVIVRLHDGLTHKSDSSARAFERCAFDGFRRLLETAGPVLLEPMMRIVVDVPDDHVGDVIGELERRRSTIVSMEKRGVTQIVETKTPLEATFGLSAKLRSLSKGRASYSAQFAHYALK